jgi:RHS repeat-associated protein
VGTTNAYNRFGALTQQARNSWVDSMHYDGSGNMIFKHEGEPNIDHSYVIDSGHNQLTQDLTTGLVPLVITYDANGSRIHELGNPADRREKHYYYDGMNRLSGTFEWVGSLQHDRPDDCQYDAEGQMVAACEGGPFLAFDGANVSGALAVGGKGWTFFHGPGLDSPLMGYYRNLSVGGPSRILYWVGDGNGRELAVADSAGIRQATDQAQDIGNWNQAGGITSSYGFSNQRQPNANATNLSFYRNRVYDQNTGRWLQEDPAGIGGGLNTYQFNGNNPTSYTDPFGLCPEGNNDCELVVSSFQAAGEVAGALFGGGPGIIETLGSGGLLAPAAVVQTAEAIVIGGAAGRALGDIIGTAMFSKKPEKEAGQQYEEIEGAQRKVRKQGQGGKIESVKKSKQRDKKELLDAAEDYLRNREE